MDKENNNNINTDDINKLYFNNLNKPINVKVKYYPKVIENMSIQCPYCNSWFRDIDIGINKAKITNNTDLTLATYKCPKCSYFFGNYSNNTNTHKEFIINEVNTENEVYKDCLHKKTVWE